MLRIKEIISNIKCYLKVLLNFKDLNKYIRLSSIFLNRLENILSSNDNIDDKYNDICKYRDYFSYKPFLTFISYNHIFF